MGLAREVDSRGFGEFESDCDYVVVFVYLCLESFVGFVEVRCDFGVGVDWCDPVEVWVIDCSRGGGVEDVWFAYKEAVEVFAGL